MVLIRERTRGSKLDETFRKKKGQVVGESSHTIKKFLIRGSLAVVSKRDMTIEKKKPVPSKTTEMSEYEGSNIESEKPDAPNLVNLPYNANLPNSDQMPEGAESSSK